MVFDFSKVDLKSTSNPVLLLKRADDTVLSTLGFSKNINLEINFNEPSKLSFEYPKSANGIDSPSYDVLNGGKIIELYGLGKFILNNPKVEITNGVKTKYCECLSLEYEFSYQKLFIPNGLYKFFDAIDNSNTIMGFILELMPSWSIDVIDSDLTSYRGIEVNNESLYDVIKNKIQITWSCIFIFDTLQRKISVRSINSTIETKPIYISQSNLAKKVEIIEHTDKIFTCVSVNGAEGVSIQSVNPMGIDKIYNLSQFMSLDNVSQNIIDQYSLWESTYQSYKATYLNLTIQHALTVQQLVTEQANLTDMENTLKSYYTLQSVYISSLASGDTSQQSNLNTINITIANQKNTILYQNQIISVIQANITSLLATMADINDETNIQSFFTEDEWKVLNRGILRQESVQEPSFYVSNVGNYDYTATTDTLSSVTFSITNSNVTESEISPYPRLRTVGELDSLTVGDLDSWTLDEMDYDRNSTDRIVYTANGGTIASSGGTISLSATIIKFSLLKNLIDESYILSLFMSDGSVYSNDFYTGCLSSTGTCGTITLDDDSLSFTVSSGNLYFTEDNTNNYQKFSVESDLLEYGEQVLTALSRPTFEFDIDCSNFLSLDEYIFFKNSLTLGSKIYLNLDDGSVLNPYLISVSIDYSNPSNFNILFSNQYCQEGIFNYKSLLDESISMGKTVNYSKLNFNSFVNSNASNSVKTYMTSALDLAKQSIISTTGQAMTYDTSGIHLRKWTDETKTSYEPKEAVLTNNIFAFTKDSWDSVSAILGDVTINGVKYYGLVADALVGSLIAGNNLYISSSKQYGGESVVKIDADGMKVVNSLIDVYANNSQISINPYRGIVAGLAPLYTDNNYTINESNAKFWLDVLTGDVNIAGDANIQGNITAQNLYFWDGTNVKTLLSSTQTKIPNTYLNLGNIQLDGTTGDITTSGNVTLGGNINLSTASSITFGTNSPVKYQFSVDGSTSWHETMTISDKYRRDSLDSGATWGTAYQFRGTDGSDASVPNYVKISGLDFTGITGNYIKSPRLFTSWLSVMPTDYSGTLADSITYNGITYTQGIRMFGKFNGVNREFFNVGMYDAGGSPELVFFSNQGSNMQMVFNSINMLSNTTFDSGYSVNFNGNLILNSGYTYGSVTQMNAISSPEEGQIFYVIP